MQYFQRRHHQRLFRLIALGCVLFYVVAACRAIVPELCETQARALQATEAGSHEQAIRAVASCCVLPGFDGGAPHSAPAGQNPSCAFCNLAKAYTETLIPFVLPVPLALAPGDPADVDAAPPLSGFGLTPPARAPPSPLPLHA